MHYTGPRRVLRATFVWTGVVITVLLGTISARAFDSIYQTAHLKHRCYAGSAGYGLFCQTDNRTTSWHRQPSISDKGGDHIRKVLNQQYDPTHLNITHPSSPSYSGPAETDIIYQ